MTVRGTAVIYDPESTVLVMGDPKLGNYANQMVVVAANPASAS